MHHDTELSALRDELAALRAIVQDLAAELATLRQSAQPAEPDAPVSRRHLLRGLAGLGAAGVAGMVATAEPAGAANGDNLVLGVDNTSTATTSLTHTTAAGSIGGGLRVSSDTNASLYVESREVGIGVRWAIVASALGTSLAANAISAEAGGGYALLGSNNSPGLPAIAGVNYGTGAGLGGVSEGGGPQLWLEPGHDSVPGPPGDRSLGEIRLDILGDIWVCVETGPPSSWTRLLREDTTPGRVVPIAPFRALDTRAPGGRAPGAPVVPGQTQGPITAGTTVTLDLAGTAGIPPTASAVVGNVTAVGPTYTGYLADYPTGTAPGTSTLNFTAGTPALSNAFTGQLTASGFTVTIGPGEGGTLHLLVDITAYIT